MGKSHSGMFSRSLTDGDRKYRIAAIGLTVGTFLGLGEARPYRIKCKELVLEAYGERERVLG